MDTVCWFMFLARPQSSSPDFGHAGGAYIKFWVAHSDEAIAEQIAHDAIADEKWRVELLEEHSFVCRQHCKNLPDSLEHFEQALVDGHCLTFYVWPPEGENSEKTSSAKP